MMLLHKHLSMHSDCYYKEMNPPAALELTAQSRIDVKVTREGRLHEHQDAILILAGEAHEWVRAWTCFCISSLQADVVSQPLSVCLF